MTKCNALASTTTDFRFRKELEEEVEGPDRDLTRGIMCMANMIRLDTMSAVREVDRQTHNPASRDQKAALRVLEYFYATRRIRIGFPREKQTSSQRMATPYMQTAG